MGEVEEEVNGEYKRASRRRDPSSESPRRRDCRDIGERNEIGTSDAFVNSACKCHHSKCQLHVATCNCEDVSWRGESATSATTPLACVRRTRERHEGVDPAHLSDLCEENEGRKRHGLDPARLSEEYGLL